MPLSPHTVITETFLNQSCLVNLLISATLEKNFQFYDIISLHQLCSYFFVKPSVIITHSKIKYLTFS